MSNLDNSNSKKIVTFDVMQGYTEKLKEKLDSKLGNSGNQIIEGSLTTSNDITVKGNLTVLGSTQTVTQETLTIKDNLIAVNGDGDKLSTTDAVGLIAINGKPLTFLKDGFYDISINDIVDICEFKVVQDDSGYSIIDGNTIESKINSLNLTPIEIYDYSGEGDMSLRVDVIGSDMGYIYFQGATQPVAAVAVSGTNEIDFYEMNGNTSCEYKNQIVKESDIELICKFLYKKVDSSWVHVTENDFITEENQAYAAPIYDSKSDSLKIGLGKYEKDNNGNITSFTFGAGQGQSIATREEGIEHGSFVSWDNNQNIFKQVPAKFKNGSIDINCPLQSNNISVKDNFISLNSEGNSLDANNQVGIITITGQENIILENGYYTIDMRKLGELLNIYIVQDMYPYISFKNNDIKNKFNSLKLFPKHIKYTNYQGDQQINCNTPIEIYIDPYNGLPSYIDIMCNGEPYTYGSGYDPDTYSTLASFKMIGPYEDNWGFSVRSHQMYLENQIIKEEDVEFLCQILKHSDTDSHMTTEDVLRKGQAYASPIYDKNQDTLKIGLGNYVKDGTGNVINFTFGVGQGQSIATRADNIENGHLIKWDATQNKLVDAGADIDRINSFIKGSEKSTFNIKGGDMYSDYINLYGNWNQPVCLYITYKRGANNYQAVLAIKSLNALMFNVDRVEIGQDYKVFVDGSSSYDSALSHFILSCCTTEGSSRGFEIQVSRPTSGDIQYTIQVTPKNMIKANEVKAYIMPYLKII